MKKTKAIERSDFLKLQKEIQEMEKKQNKLFTGFCKKYGINSLLQDWLFDLCFNYNPKQADYIEEQMKSLGLVIK